MAQKAYSLSHTKWMCKYHIVFTPKYRRKVIYNQIRSDIGEILRKLCEYKGIEIIEGHLMPDHVHVLLAIPPKYSVASVMGCLKGKSSLMIFDRHANLKYKFGNRKFWAEGYYVSMLASIYFSPFSPTYFRQSRQRGCAGFANADAPLSASRLPPPSRPRRRWIRPSGGTTVPLS